MVPSRGVTGKPLGERIAEHRDGDMIRLATAVTLSNAKARDRPIPSSAAPVHGIRSVRSVG
jgi:hypothetical protein